MTVSIPDKPVVTTAPTTEPINKFMRRSLDAGLDAEEIASEIKARYNIDLTPPEVYAPEESPLFEGIRETPKEVGVPEGMRLKTTPEEIMEPISSASGIVGGVIEKFGDIVGPNILESYMGMELPAIQQAREASGKELREVRRDIDKEFAEREGAPALENVRKDLTDMAEGILEIIRVIRGAEEYTEERKSTVEHLWGKQKEGSITGRQFMTGAAADIWAMGDDPELYIRSRPVTAAMILAEPLAEISALAKVNHPPALKVLKDYPIERLNKVVNKVKRKLQGTERGVKAKRSAEKIARNVGERWDSLQRWVKDPYVQQTEKASKLTQELISTAKETNQSVQQIARRWATTVQRGHERLVPPEPKTKKPGIKFDYEKVEKLVGPAKVKRRWSAPDTIKVVTQEIDYNPTTAHFGGKREIGLILAEAFDDYKAGIIDKKQYDEFVKYVHKREAKPTSIFIANTNWTDAASRFVDDLAKLKHVDPNFVLAELNRNLAKQGVGFLRSRNIRKLVTDDIVEQVREAGIYTPEQIVNLQEKLGVYLDEFRRRDPSSPSYEANAVINFSTTGTPLEISIADTVLKVIDENPKLNKRIYAELIAETGADVARDSRLNVIAESLKENMPLFTTEAEWINNAIESVIVKGEELPPLIQDNPHHIATRLIDGVDKWEQAILRDYPDWLETASTKTPDQELRELAHKIRSYKRMPEEIVKAFGLQDYIIANKNVTPPHARVKAAPAKFEYEVFAPQGVIDTLQWELNAKKAVDEATTFWDVLNRQIKGNLTARNLASALNNIRANFVYQTMRRQDPVLAKDLVTMIREYHGFRTGKSLAGEKFYKLTPEKNEFFKAMERTGVLDTTALDIELGGLGVSDVIPVLKKITPALERFYKAGDNIFKLEEGWHNYSKLKQVLSELDDGNFISFEVLNGKKVKLVKRNWGWEMNVGDKLRPLKTESQLNDIIASASSVPAQRIFFDYSRVGNAIKWVRASKALGVTSPFFTWFWKSMDIPGLKRGLIREVLTDGVTYSTDNFKINAKRQAEILASSAKKAAMLAGLREAVKEPNNSELLRKVLSYDPASMSFQLLEQLTNPMWIGYDSEQSTNQFSASDAVIRGIMAGQALFLNDQEIVEQLYPEEHGKFGKQIDFDLSTVEDLEIRNDILARRYLLKKHHTREGFTPKDAAAMVAISGTPILDGVIMLDAASRQGGKAVSPAKITQMITTALMGGTAAALLDISVAALVDPNSPSKLLTTRRWAENDISEPQERFIKWAMRRITGIGFRPLDVGKRSERYFSQKEHEWKSSLTGDLRALLKENPDLSDTDRANMIARINQLEKIVEGEIMLEKLNFDEVFDKLRKGVEKK